MNSITLSNSPLESILLLFAISQMLPASKVILQLTNLYMCNGTIETVEVEVEAELYFI